MELRNALSARFGLQLPATAVFDYPSVRALAGYIATGLPLPACSPARCALPPLCLTVSLLPACSLAALPASVDAPGIVDDDSELELALSSPLSASLAEPESLFTEMLGAGCVYPSYDSAGGKRMSG